MANRTKPPYGGGAVTQINNPLPPAQLVPQLVDPNYADTGAPSGLRNLVPVRHRLSLGWGSTMATRNGTAGITDYLSLWAPPTAYAFRLISGNAIGTGWTFPIAKFRASNTYADGANPDGAAPWQAVTWDTTVVNTDVDWVKIGGAATTLAVPGFAGTAFPETGNTGVFDFYASDWMPILTTGAQLGFGPDLTSWKYLMIRQQRPIATNSQAAPAASIGQGNSNGLPHMNGVQMYMNVRGADDVTAPGVIATPPWVTTTQSYMAVQFMCYSPGIQGGIFGDSHANGSGATLNWGGFFARACLAISKPQLPVFPWVTGNTGGASDIYCPMFERVMTYQNFSFVCCPSWTWNEASGATTGPAYHLSRVLTLSERLRKTGGVPILLAPMPRDAASAVGGVLTNWRDIRARVLALKGIPVFDPVPFVGNLANGVPDATFAPGMSTDNVHPNDAGHAAIAAGLVPFLRQAIGLSS